MFDCPDCEFSARSKGGLASHCRTQHPDETPDAPDSVVLASVVAQLPEDAPPGLKAAAMKLAWAMDVTTSTRDLASLSRELRAVLSEISTDEEPEADGVDDLAARRAARRAAAAGGVGS